MELSLDWHELAELIGVGTPGPLDKDGIPQQRYISVINNEAGERLLDRLRIVEDVSGVRATEGLSGDELWDLGETDAETISRRRREQARLRAHLLGRRVSANYDICGRGLPAALLVAAHIIPRAVSDNEHRKDFASIAMLSCSLGCDDLFERGYVVVDEAGVVRGGRAGETPSLASAIDQLTSRGCTAHNERTAADFAAHARLVLA